MHGQIPAREAALTERDILNSPFAKWEGKPGCGVFQVRLDKPGRIDRQVIRSSAATLRYVQYIYHHAYETTAYCRCLSFVKFKVSCRERRIFKTITVWLRAVLLFLSTGKRPRGKRAWRIKVRTLFGRES